MSEEALKIAEERRDGKGNGERERYTQLNAQLQRIARRDKKAFLSGQWNEIEENNRMGKTRDLFRKVGDIKGTFHARMVTIKERKRKDLIEAEEIKKCQEYTEEQKNYTRKVLMTQITMVVSVVSHLESDILEHEIKWALGSITMNKANGGEKIPTELFKIPKGDAVKVLHSMLAYLENSAVTTGLEKVSFHSIPKEGQFQRMFNVLYS